MSLHCFLLVEGTTYRGTGDPKAGCGHSTGIGALFSTAVWVSQQNS